MVLGIAALGIFVWWVLMPTWAHAQFSTATDQGSQFGLAGGGSTVNPVTLVQTFVKWVLSIIWVIALIMALYGGFQMVTSAGDETKYKAGFKVLKNAAIGLIVIGLSWIIVSIIFWAITQTGNAATTAATKTP